MVDRIKAVNGVSNQNHRGIPLTTRSVTKMVFHSMIPWRFYLEIRKSETSPIQSLVYTAWAEKREQFGPLLATLFGSPRPLSHPDRRPSKTPAHCQNLTMAGQTRKTQKGSCSMMVSINKSNGSQRKTKNEKNREKPQQSEPTTGGHHSERNQHTTRSQLGPRYVGEALSKKFVKWQTTAWTVSNESFLWRQQDQNSTEKHPMHRQKKLVLRNPRFTK